MSIVAAAWSFVREEEEIEKEEEEGGLVIAPERGRAVVRMKDCIPRQKVAAVRRRNAVVTKTPLGCIAAVADNTDDFKWLGCCELVKPPAAVAVFFETSGCAAHASARATAAIHIEKRNIQITTKRQGR